VCVFIFGSMNNKRILVVDDDRSLIKLYRFFLKEHGYSLFIAKNGKEAIEKYLNFSNIVKLIIMDHHMPIMNGIEAMKKILNLKPKINVIITSSDLSIKDLAIRLGAKEFLPKPFNFMELIGLIKKISKIR